MKVTILLIIFVLLVGCGKTSTKEALCKRWVMEELPKICVTTFNLDGSVLVKYAEGRGYDVSGTWKQQDDGAFLIKLRPWEMNGRIDGNKLIMKAGKNECTYIEEETGRLPNE